MPTLAQLRNAVDARLATLWTNQVLPRQAAYFAAHGRYWQGIVTTDRINLPNTLTADAAAAEMVPDKTRKPTDQNENWTDAGLPLEATIPMGLCIDVYDGPLGMGYVGVVVAKHNGTIYSRAQNFGPETWRTLPWASELVN